ncbi:MAG: pyridoxal phosphate-dependent aminotransferase, partial [Flavobacteriaceae bacterium]|nr:pyridoxal phosphate-dependent aminotransferase [Flavobacteriaceae bacterium]
MPTISKKGYNMPQSPIRKLVPFAENAYKQGKTVYHLNIGQPDIKTPQIALDAVSTHSLEIIAYSRSEGSEEFRQKIAKYYEQHHIFVDHSDIIVTTGGSEALLFAFGSIM